MISTVNVAGGANRSLLDLLPYIIDAGHECTILASAHGTMEDAVKKLGIPYKVIPFSTYVETTSLYRRIKRRTANIYGKHAIKRFLRKEKFDLVHNNSLPTAVGMHAAHMLHIPYICHIRENIWTGLGMEFYCPKVIKKLIRDARMNITISDYIKQIYRKFEQSGRYMTINDGISVGDYYDSREIFSGENVAMAIFGVINPQKGQREAVEALEIVRSRGYTNVYLDIIGSDGNWKGSREYALGLKRYVEEKQLSCINFVPPIEDTEELKRRRSSYDINLICSNAEGLGRTTVESMLSGALTIAADAGATPEILTDQQHGLLYESGQAEKLADCIEYALLHKKEMQDMAGKAREYAAARFAPDRYAEKILQLYEKTANHTKR